MTMSNFLKCILLAAASPALTDVADTYSCSKCISHCHVPCQTLTILRKDEVKTVWAQFAGDFMALSRKELMHALVPSKPNHSVVDGGQGDQCRVCTRDQGYPCRQSTHVPQMQVCSAQSGVPSRKPIATRMASSSRRSPHEETGSACSQSPLCGDDTAISRARSRSVDAFSKRISDACLIEAWSQLL